jgi:hypothetical protein
MSIERLKKIALDMQGVAIPKDDFEFMLKSIPSLVKCAELLKESAHCVSKAADDDPTPIAKHYLVLHSEIVTTLKNLDRTEGAVK